MAAADIARAEWLRSTELVEAAENAIITTRWGDDALSTRASSGYTTQSAAAAEASRQLSYFGKPSAIDSVTVPGLHRDYEGRWITVTFNRLGYSGGKLVQVIGVEALDLDANTTTFKVRADL